MPVNIKGLNLTGSGTKAARRFQDDFSETTITMKRRYLHGGTNATAVATVGGVRRCTDSGGLAEFCWWIPKSIAQAVEAQNQYSQVVFVARSGTQPRSGPGVFMESDNRTMRASIVTGSFQGYYLQSAPDFGTWSLQKLLDSVLTVLGTFAFSAPGDTVRLEVRVTGAGATLDCFNNGVNQLSVLDAAPNHFFTGLPGIADRDSTAGHSIDFDNLDCGRL
jgi:hypothetical protein